MPLMHRVPLYARSTWSVDATDEHTDAPKFLEALSAKCAVCISLITSSVERMSVGHRWDAGASNTGGYSRTLCVTLVTEPRCNLA